MLIYDRSTPTDERFIVDKGECQDRLLRNIGHDEWSIGVCIQLKRGTVVLITLFPLTKH